MDASKKNIGDVINKYRILDIPFFQRPYVWGEEQWSRLLEDLEEVSQSGKAFLGVSDFEAIANGIAARIETDAWAKHLDGRPRP